jgi:hypothetical protein
MMHIELGVFEHTACCMVISSIEQHSVLLMSNQA